MSISKKILWSFIFGVIIFLLTFVVEKSAQISFLEPILPVFGIIYLPIYIFIIFPPLLAGVIFSDFYNIIISLEWAILFFIFLKIKYKNVGNLNNNKPKNKKLRLFIFVLVLLIVAIIGIFYWINNYQHDAKRLTELAVKTNDPLICDIADDSEFMSGQSRSNCYFQIGREHNNLLACEKYGGGICLATVAQQLRDSSICQKIDFRNEEKNRQERNDCWKAYYSYFIVSESNISICNIIEHKTEKAICIDRYAFEHPEKITLDICEENFKYLESSYFGNDCYMAVAINKMDIKICEKLFPINLVNLCKERIKN